MSPPIYINQTTIHLPGNGGLNLRNPTTGNIFHVSIEVGHAYLEFDSKLSRSVLERHGGRLEERVREG
ncbi:hypothetical protein QCA50_018404 [Cerrena zonata]|uniref:Uncharacterized protein n=1 Tax=Cerrena zonata TaxID=2478898 RepID=A0AAW0FEG0_9APHY